MIRRWLWLIAAALLLPVLVVGTTALRNVSAPEAADSSSSQLRAEPSPVWKEETTLKVVTFNIQNTWVVGHHRAVRMRAIAKKLTELDPDLVAFQEALVDADREILIRELQGSRLHYHHYFRSRRWGSGLLICSAWPIRETLFHRFSQSNEWFKVWEGDWWIGKGVALARIERPGGALLDFYTTHTQAGYDNPRYHLVRASQLIELAGFIHSTCCGTVPALLAGDMNCRPIHDEYKAVVEQARLDRMMIGASGVDYIFAVRDARYSAEVLETQRIEQRIEDGGKWFDLSDHPGFLSTIRIRPAK